MVETKEVRRQVNPSLSARDRLIVALDYPNKKDALALVHALGNEIGFYKVGWYLFLNEGKDFVKSLIQEHRKKVFLDLKMEDISATVEDTVRSISDLGVEFLTLHGNGATVRAAKLGRGDRGKPLFLSVTFLSSLDQTDLRDLFFRDDLKLSDYIRMKAEQTLDAGCDGLIASGESVAELRSSLLPRRPIIVTPGIRPTGASQHDHKRTLTPSEAIKAGADYLVVGRPIREASNPAAVSQSIVSQIEAGLT